MISYWLTTQCSPPIPTPSPTVIRKFAQTAARPEFVRAWLIPKAHAMATYNDQSIESRASWGDRSPIVTIMIDVKSAQTRRGAVGRSTEDTASMATRSTMAGKKYFKRGGAESLTAAKRAKAWSLFTFLLRKVGPASRSSTSPA